MNKKSLSYILLASQFLFSVSDVRGEEDSGDGGGSGDDGSGTDPEGSGTDLCEGYECENENDVCKVKQICVGDECQNAPVCESYGKTQDAVLRRCRKRNEIYLFCGSKCEPTCDKQNPRCRRGCKWFVCQCKKGYVRNSDGECVRTWQCPKKCDKYEEYKRCGTSCEPTCRDQNPSFCRPCKRNVCQCKDGYVRSRRGNCIPKSWCRRG